MIVDILLSILFTMFILSLCAGMIAGVVGMLLPPKNGSRVKGGK